MTLALLLVVLAVLAALMLLALLTLWAGRLLNWLLPLAGESPVASVARRCGRRLRWVLPPEACECPWKRDDAPMHLYWCPRAPARTRR